MNVRSIIVPLIPIPSPADNALVDPLGLLSHTFSFQRTYASLKLTIAEPVPWTPFSPQILTQCSQCKKFLSKFHLDTLEFHGLCHSCVSYINTVSFTLEGFIPNKRTNK